MRIKIISQVHIIRNKLGNMYTVAVACADLYIIYYSYKILNKTLMNQQSFIALTSNKFPCKPIQPFSVDISDRWTASQPERQTDRQTDRQSSCTKCSAGMPTYIQIVDIHQAHEAGSIKTEEMEKQWVQPGS